MRIKKNCAPLCDVLCCLISLPITFDAIYMTFVDLLALNKW